MAYDFLGLVNQVNRRLNEVELTTDNFATATGFYAHAKDAVNSAIRDINQIEYNWPFNHVEEEEDVSVNTMRYEFASDAKTVSMDTFRIKESSTLGVATKKLKHISYEEYLDKYIHLEYNNNNTGVPDYVFRAPNLQYGLVPAPDKAYTIIYEYYVFPSDLELQDDIPSIPERFAHVIVNGAMFYAYLFRGNTQDSLVAKEKFEEGLKSMRSLLINRYDYVRSNMINRNTFASNILS
jgi:hypothetical protein